MTRNSSASVCGGRQPQRRDRALLSILVDDPDRDALMLEFVAQRLHLIAEMPRHDKGLGDLGGLEQAQVPGHQRCAPYLLGQLRERGVGRSGAPAAGQHDGDGCHPAVHSRARSSAARRTAWRDVVAIENPSRCMREVSNAYLGTSPTHPNGESP